MSAFQDKRDVQIATIASLTAEIERLRSVLEYIARNTCCDTCQEAALVAKEALTGPMANTRAALQAKEKQ